MRYFFLIGFLLFSFLVVINFKNKYIEFKLASSEGITVVATIKRIPEICQRRNNRILANYIKKEYSVLISKKNCISGRYRVGNKVEMIYVSRFDKLFIENSFAEFNYYLSIILFLIPLGLLFALLKKKP